MLSKRSKKEFQELMNDSRRLPSFDLQECADFLLDWFDSGEKSITLKEMQILADSDEFEKWCEENCFFTTDLDSFLAWIIGLFSTKEGLELIEKILSEVDQK